MTSPFLGLICRRPRAGLSIGGVAAALLLVLNAAPTADTTIAELTAFRTVAVSRLAAQHDKILRLRQQIASYGNVRVLHPKPGHDDQSG